MLYLETQFLEVGPELSWRELMQEHFNFIDILVKSLKTKAKKSELPQRKALNELSKAYGFKDYFDLNKLNTYILLTFESASLKLEDKRTPITRNVLNKSGFSLMNSSAEIHSFIAQQHLARCFDLFVGPPALSDYETYILQTKIDFNEIDDLKSFIIENLDTSPMSIIYDGNLYNFEFLDDRDKDLVFEYSYFNEDNFL